MEAEKKSKPDLLVVRHLTEKLSISRTKAYELKSAGRLPRCVRLDGCVRWRAADIDLWIKLGCPSADKFEALKKAKV
jgi:predicted DNA-binding transcriptional regulator AlpA